jgi:hypothetical protein
MNTSMRTRSIVAVLVLSAIAPVAPAAAGVYGPLTESPQTAQRSDSAAQRNDSSTIVLRRDGSQAVPFVADLGREAADGSNYQSVNAIVPPASEPSSAEPGYASANAITGPPTGEPTIVSGPAGDSADGFDWGDAALGAGAAMAGLFALGAAVLLATRRRTGMSPSASTS